MTRRIDNIYARVTGLAVPQHRRTFRQDGDAALAFLIIGIHGALDRGFIGAKDAGLGQQLIDQCRLAMVNVCDNRDIPQIHDRVRCV